MQSINWKKGFFRLTCGLSILFSILAGAKAEDSFDLGWTAFLAPFVDYFFDLNLSPRSSEFDSDIFWSFFVVYAGFIWIIYFIGIWSARGFSNKKKKSLINRFFSAIITNPTDRSKDESTQD